MAEDTGIINGVGASSIAPQFDGGFAVIAGMIIAFYHCW